MNSRSRYVGYSSPAKAKHPRFIFLVVIFILVVILVRDATSKADSPSTDQKEDSLEVHKQVANYSPIDNEVQGVESVKNFSIDGFFKYLKETNYGYNFDIFESTFQWKEGGRTLNLKGTEITTKTTRGANAIEMDARRYLEGFDFVLDSENLSGSDSGDGVVGMKKGADVCLIETNCDGRFAVTCGSGI